MNNYILSCCSTADLSLDHIKRRNLNYISFHFTINGTEYPDDLGQSLPFDEFYALMEKGAETKTSQVNVDEFINYFTPFLKEGKDILHISISTGLSGAFNSANIAKSILEEEFPDRKIIIIDSLAASSGYGLIMDKAADLKDEGLPIEDLAIWIEENKLNMNHWFYSTDLSYYVKGGRITKAAGFIGTMLNMNPLLNMDDKGKLIPRHKVVGRKRVQNKIVEKMAENATNGLAYADKCYISHSNFIDDANLVSKIITDKFPHLKGNVEINSVGTTIGSHTGPGTLALFFWGNKRVE